MTEHDEHDRIKQDIRKIAEDSKDVEKDISVYVKKQFDEKLEKAGSVASDVNASARQMLEGVADGLTEAGHKSSDLLVKVAGILVDETQEITRKSVEVARQHAASARAAMDKALEETKGDVGKLAEHTKSEMQQAHSELYNKTRDMLGKMETVSKAVYDYSSEKAQQLGDKAGPKLKDISQKAVSATEEAEKSAALYSEKFLQHGQEKTAGWLRKLAGLVEPDKKPDKKGED